MKYFSFYLLWHENNKDARYGFCMNKLYSWDLYDKSKIDSRRLATTIHEAWITSGYVIAENIDEAKEKIGMSFDLTNGKYVLNFDLGESFMNKYYIQDDKNSDVFIEEFLLEGNEETR